MNLGGFEPDTTNGTMAKKKRQKVKQQTEKIGKVIVRVSKTNKRGGGSYKRKIVDH